MYVESRILYIRKKVGYWISVKSWILDIYQNSNIENSSKVRNCLYILILYIHQNSNIVYFSKVGYLSKFGYCTYIRKKSEIGYP